MSIQTITSPSGETLVVLSQREYDQLVDSADIATAAHVRRDIELGDDELLPADLVAALLEGHNPVRLWRNHRGMSARQLAEQVGISPAYLSEIESGKKDGRVSVLKRLAGTLNVTLDDLV